MAQVADDSAGPESNISVLLAHTYEEGKIDPTGWWMSEKLDGVRAYWNGQYLFSRHGNAFHPPPCFTEDLPHDMHLDGELFGGRQTFQSTLSIVKTSRSPRWREIKYWVFDAPHMEREPFERRRSALIDRFAAAMPQYVKLVDHEQCTGREHLDMKFDSVIALGGEGLMIRKPNSEYERRRSKTLLKIKKFHRASARVVGYKPSNNTPGLISSLKVEMANGNQFNVGSGLNNEQKRNPPRIGTIITYKFQEYTDSGIPRFPTFVCIQPDMTGPQDAEDVVTEAMDD